MLLDQCQKACTVFLTLDEIVFIVVVDVDEMPLELVTGLRGLCLADGSVVVPVTGRPMPDPAL